MSAFSLHHSFPWEHVRSQGMAGKGAMDLFPGSPGTMKAGREPCISPATWRTAARGGAIRSCHGAVPHHPVISP